MTITVEDGTNVPDANSYVTVAELDTYADERGIVLPAADADKEILLIKAMDYIATLDDRFLGYREFTDQVLSYPRIYDYLSTAIPKNLKRAQIVLAVAAMTIDLLPKSAASSAYAKRKTVGPITVEYSATSGASQRPSIPEVDNLLGSLMGAGSFGQLRVIRA